MKELSDTLEQGASLTAEEARRAARELLEDPPTEEAVEQRVTLLQLLAEKGETPEEISAFAEVFLDHAVPFPLDPADSSLPWIDVCGTGGDRLDLFNVSTTAMFLVAAGGAGVVKHGNRSVSSKCGGADVLEALGIRLDLTPEEAANRFQRDGLIFLFAHAYHPAFRSVVPVRKALAAQGIRTVFNILGPLLNPARPAFQLAGVFSPELPPIYADILTRLGRKRAWAVHGKTEDGAPMDEVSTLGETEIVQTEAGKITTLDSLHPDSLGFYVPDLSALVGGDAKTNAEITLGILSGKDRGPKRDLVVLNAACALTVAGCASDLEGGIALANEVIDNGEALAKLRAMQTA
ncbi:MAG: anthranilate phosphoribosyltransferase [Verrucomicrobiota bacterium]